MDGKKRIARLRNAEKWKKLGFVAPLRKAERQKIEADKLEKIREKIRDDIVAKAPVVLNIPCIGRAFIQKQPREGFIFSVDRWGSTIEVPKNPFKSAMGYIGWLQKKGWKHLGSGAYSSVYGKDGQDRVIKISRTLDNWIDYVQWAVKNGYAGNLAPRVFSWKRFKGEQSPWGTNDWSVAVVERMDQTVRDNDYKSDRALVMQLTYPARRGNLMAQLYMEELMPGSVKFFKELADNGFSGDVGGGNVMLRKDGTLCVTDPTCGDIRTTVKRLRTGELSPSALVDYEKNRTVYIRLDWLSFCNLS